jgi:hypothetical protein
MHTLSASERKHIASCSFPDRSHTGAVSEHGYIRLLTGGQGPIYADTASSYINYADPVYLLVRKNNELHNAHSIRTALQ